MWNVFLFPLVVFSSSPTLVIVDDLSLRESHSKFFDGLKSKGFNLEFRMYSDKTFSVWNYGEHVYENIILMAPTAQFPNREVRSSSHKTSDGDRAEARKREVSWRTPRGVSLQDLTDYVDSGRNLLVMVDRDIMHDNRKIANEHGVDFDEQESTVVDHAKVHSADGGDHTMFITSITQKSPITQDGRDILYRGVGMALSQTNKHVFSILSGNPTSYSVGADMGVLSSGSAVTLAAALQSRNNARTTFFGSIEACGDAFIRLNGHNRSFCLDLALWTFHRRGVLRHSNMHHHKVGETVAPYAYRMTDQITFNIDVEELIEDEWQPYRGKDIQLEFVMMDPYQRMFFKAPNKGKTFSVTFTAPDVYGVFKFRIDYERYGYNWIFIEDVVPLRNFKHNDYERFIWCATPYYASCATTLIGLFIFCVVFFYSKDPMPVRAVSFSGKRASGQIDLPEVESRSSRSTSWFVSGSSPRASPRSSET